MDNVASASASETLGPFRVIADAATVARFAQAVGASAERVPATFPIVWLALPEIRSAIEARVQAGEVVFHEDQSFRYTAALEPGVDYEMTAVVERRADPARVAIAGAVRWNGATVLDMETLLRVIARPDVAVHQHGAAQQ